MSESIMGQEVDERLASSASPSLVSGPTRQSSFQSSIASVYQDAGTPFRSDSELGLRSDLNTSSASFASASSVATVGAARPSAAEPSHSNRTSIDRTRTSLQGRSVDLSRPLSPQSTNNRAEHDRLRDAASAAARRSSVSQRPRSVELGRMSQNLGRKSTDSLGQTRPVTAMSQAPEAAPARDHGSILPPAAFFAPKKPAARNSASNLLSPSQTNLTGEGRSNTPFSFTSVASQVDRQDESGLRTPSPFGMLNAAERRTSSPWGINPSIHSSDAGARDRSNPRLDSLKNEADPVPGSASPKSTVRMMASTDPLIQSAAHNTAPATPRAALALNGVPAYPAPVQHKQTTAKTQRNYRRFRGNSRFLFGGLLMSSGDNPISFILSYAVLLVLGGLFYGFEAPWLTRNISPAVVAFFTYIWLLAVVNMGVTAWKDPGVLPRDLDPDPPCVLGDSAYEGGRQPLADPEDPLAIPVQRVLRIRNQTVQVKWCETCGTYRPPRSSHCRVCDNCVENIDHHCTFLNTCIGRRNYLPFMVFLTTSIVAALIVIAFTVVHLVLLTKSTTYRYPRGNAFAPGLDFRGALQRSPVSAVLFLLCLGLLAPVGTLYVYHIRLVLLNRSTVEQIRISTARDYGQHKELELTDDRRSDAGSITNGGGANQHGRRAGPLTALLSLVGFNGAKYKDPNPFATRKTTKNLRNGVGWRSIDLESWIDRRGTHPPDSRLPHPKHSTTPPPHTHTNGTQWHP